MSIFKNRTVIGVICILLALVICFGITPLFNRGISQKAEIVRVTKDIHAGELITKDMPHRSEHTKNASEHATIGNWWTSSPMKGLLA